MPNIKNGDESVVIRDPLSFIAPAFNSFGITKNEAYLYIALLELGEASMGDIAKKTKFPRSTCYEIIRGLQNRHLATFYEKRKKKIYVAEDPSAIAAFFEQKAGSLKELAPKLQILSGRMAGKPFIRLYEGEDGLKTILHQIIIEKRNFDAITSIEDAQALLQRDFEDFIEERKKRRLRVRLLTQNSSGGKKLKSKDNEEFRLTRFVPAAYDFQTANFIFGDKVALLDLAGKHPLGVLIKDEVVAGTFKMYFEIMWNQAESAI